MPFESQQDELLTVLSHHAGVGLWDAVIVDADPFGPLSQWQWSSEFRRLLGFSSVATFPNVHQSWMDRIHPDDFASTMAVVGAAVGSVAPVAHYDTKFRLLHADETYRWFRAVGGVVHDDRGMATRACGSLIDIHDGELATVENSRRTWEEMNRLSAARDASQERFLQMAATSPSGIICTDAEGIVTFWNNACANLYGATAQEMVGRHLDVAIAPEGRFGSDFNTAVSGLVGRTVEYVMLHSDGTKVDIDLSTSQWQEGNRSCYGFIGSDIRERKAREEVLATLAHCDPLTGLPNRMLLRERIEAALASSDPFCVMMIDLDGFKQINDTLGHETGDAVLEAVAKRLLSCLGEGDTAARFGGDEFTLVVLGSGDLEHASTLAETVIAAVSHPILVNSASLFVGASIGIAFAPEHGRTASELLSSADAALYAAKSEGRGCFRSFQPQLKEAAANLITHRRELHDAIVRNEFELYYQSQHRLIDGMLTGVEALLRWRHPQHGILTPDRFLETLQGSRWALATGDWILNEACRQVSEWRRIHPSLRMSVNLFPVQIHDPRLAEKVMQALDVHDLPASALELEIPETVRIDISVEQKQALAELLACGVGIAFDDYGTGYANLSSLRDFPLSRLKIDRSFVQGMVTSLVDRAVVKSIMLLGGELGLAVIAEGIETLGQMTMLSGNGCLEGQGYLLCRPTSAREFIDRFTTSVAAA